MNVYFFWRRVSCGITLLAVCIWQWSVFCPHSSAEGLFELVPEIT